MKKTFVFVGWLAAHMMGVVSFEKWGQRVELTEEQAGDLSIGGAAIVPEEDFEKLGVLPAEMLRYAAFGALANATPEFAVKKVAAVRLVEEFRARCVAAMEGLEA